MTGPPPRGKLTDEELANLRLDASSAVKDIVGPGYVPGFYQNEAGSIVGLVEHWVDRVEQRIHNEWLDRLLRVGREWPQAQEENMAAQPVKATTPQKAAEARQKLTINERIDAIVVGLEGVQTVIGKMQDTQDTGTKHLDTINDIVEALTVRIEEQSAEITDLKRRMRGQNDMMSNAVHRLIELEKTRDGQEARQNIQSERLTEVLRMVTALGEKLSPPDSTMWRVQRTWEVRARNVTDALEAAVPGGNYTSTASIIEESAAEDV